MNYSQTVNVQTEGSQGDIGLKGSYQKGIIDDGMILYPDLKSTDQSRNELLSHAELFVLYVHA